MDFVLSYGIQNTTPIFLALKVSFKVGFSLVTES